MKLVLGRQNPTFSVKAVQLRADITYSKATVSVIIDERGLNKYARDYINEVDMMTFLVGKTLLTNATASEAISQVAVTKPLSPDTYSPEDEIDVSATFIRSYSHTFGSTEAITSKESIKWLSDNVAAQDAITGKSVSTLYIDSQTLYDNADANSGDGLEWVEVKPATDSTLTADLLASIDAFKLLTDVANAASTGSLRMTDYVDITYFAEDYVGSSRTIS